MANVPYPSAVDTVSFLSVASPSIIKYSTAPFTPASMSVAFILLNIVVPTGLDCKYSIIDVLGNMNEINCNKIIKLDYTREVKRAFCY